jgi:hypothetical protein
LGSGPSTLNFDLGSQPNIPLAAFGVQSSPRPPQATSNAPVALERTSPNLSATEDGMPAISDFDPSLRARRKKKAPIALVLGALLTAGAVVGGFALRSTLAEADRATKVAAPAPTRPAIVAPAPEEEAAAPEPAAVDAGAKHEPKRAPRPQVAGAAPSPAPAWSPPPPKPSKDRKLGDVGHTDEF